MMFFQLHVYSVVLQLKEELCGKLPKSHQSLCIQLLKRPLAHWLEEENRLILKIKESDRNTRSLVFQNTCLFNSTTSESAQSHVNAELPHFLKTPIHIQMCIVNTSKNTKHNQKKKKKRKHPKTKLNKTCMNFRYCDL